MGCKSNQEQEALLPAQHKVIRKRRTRVKDRPNIQFNVWSFIKNSIGKDLSRLPVPISFNEPMSMLQKFTESDAEYAEMLHKAAQIQDDCEQVL